MNGDAKADTLHGLLAARRDELVAAWAEAIKRSIAAAALPRPELLDRMPEFVDQIIAALHPEALPLPPAGENAEEHGAQRMRMGFDVAEVIHEYGLLHRCILDIAAQGGQPVNLREQQLLAHWLNGGIAEAVAQYVKQRDLELQRQNHEHLGFIAHEVRNPLSSARLAFERLRKTSGDSNAMQSRWADVLDRNLRRTVDLVDGVLGQASLQMGVEPAFERVELASFLREIILDSEAEARSRSIDTAVEGASDIVIDADPRLLRSAVSNLLHNALKFSKSPSKVTITTTRSAGRLEIEVADACGGLAPGKAEELFAPLVQRNENRDGFGLGLAIALQAVQAHRGTIRVRDIPGDGCVFTIELPTASAS